MSQDEDDTNGRYSKRPRKEYDNSQDQLVAEALRERPFIPRHDEVMLVR